MKCSLGISNFLEEISSLSHSIVSLFSLHWFLRKAFLSLLAICWNSAFKWVYLSFSPLLFPFSSFTAICKTSSGNHFAFLHFFFWGLVLIPVSYTVSPTSIHSSSGTLSIRSAAAAAAKSLQSCPTLCDHIVGSPLVSSVPGILQARILEWVAISFSNAWKWKVKSVSHARLLATPWTAAYQAPPSMGFSRSSPLNLFLTSTVQL